MVRRLKPAIVVLMTLLVGCSWLRRGEQGFCEYLVNAVAADADCECPVKVDDRVCLKPECRNATDCPGLANPSIVLTCRNNPRKTCTIVVDNTVDRNGNPREIACRDCAPID